MMQISGTGWALTTTSVVSVLWLGPDAASLVEVLNGPSFPEAAVAAASLALLTVSAWVVVATTVATLVGALGLSSRWVRVLTPRLLRRALFTGAASVLALSPAHAATLDTHRDAPPGTHPVSGLRLPDRPSNTLPAEALRPVGAPVTPAASAVVVRRGDTLWAIAARSLPPGATDTAVAQACAAWHTANRDVIGDDPDRIFPTQRLTPPSGKDPS